MLAFQNAVMMLFSLNRKKEREKRVTICSFLLCTAITFGATKRVITLC